MLHSAHIGNYNKHYAFFNQGPVWRDNQSWDAITKRSVQWPMVYRASPPLDPDSQSDPNGTDFVASAIIDNSPAMVYGTDPGCPDGVGALFSFGWPQNGSSASHRAEGWYEVLKNIDGLPEPSSVVGQAWAEEAYIMGAYGAWWPPQVLSAAKEEWNALSTGPIFFAGTEWSAIGSGYMNGAVHNGRKHGRLVAKLLQ